MLMVEKNRICNTLLIVDDFMKCYNVRNFKCAFKESF